mgnify:CR=1 FL=1
MLAFLGMSSGLLPDLQYSFHSLLPFRFNALANSLGDQISEEERQALCNPITVCDPNWLYDPDYDPKKVGGGTTTNCDNQ